MAEQIHAGYKFSIDGLPVYPHIKLTSEQFPRALATRILKDDGNEYFGAFLNRTSVRILIDFLNRTFKLRSCTIPIDGTFPVPCTQYYAKRCLAPCVASLCDHESYLEMVDLVRLFLRNDRELFLAAVSKKIESAAEELDFETAGAYRDVLQAVESYWANARWQVWLDDSVDTFDLQEEDGWISVIIISQRRSRALGELVYKFEKSQSVASTQAIADVMLQFYEHHLPREIRVSDDFDDRNALTKELGRKFGRKIKIVVAKSARRRVTTDRALDRTKERIMLEALSDKASDAEIAAELARTFQMRKAPSHVEAFDAAHISATGFAAAVAVWRVGLDSSNEFEHWISDRESELETVRAFVADRVGRTTPDMILIDGGPAHLRAGVEAVSKISRPPRVIAAVKPKGKHMSVSHFLTDDDRRIDFDQDVHAFRILQRLRDEAHALANATHRLGRDMMHFYELASMLPSLDERERQALLRDVGSIRGIVELDEDEFVKRFGKKKAKAVLNDLASYHAGHVSPRPLIVPIRYVEADGAADDLIPINSRT
jgi:excinuclease ABC subunit C